VTKIKEKMETKTKKILIGAGIVVTLLGLGYAARRIECRRLEKANDFYAQAVKFKEAGDYKTALDYIGKGRGVITGYYGDLKYDMPLAVDKADKISKKLKNLQDALK